MQHWTINAGEDDFVDQMRRCRYRSESIRQSGIVGQEFVLLCEFRARRNTRNGKYRDAASNPGHVAHCFSKTDFRSSIRLLSFKAIHYIVSSSIRIDLRTDGDYGNDDSEVSQFSLRKLDHCYVTSILESHRHLIPESIFIKS